VGAVLPQDLRLAANHSSTPTVHPVVYLYGKQINTKWVIMGETWSVGEDYQELILLIPFVQRHDSNRWHNFVVIIYLNDRPALEIGNRKYGYAKHMANFRETDPEVTVSMDGRQTFHAKIDELDSSWRTSKEAEHTLPNYKDVQTIFQMPVLGMEDESPNFICSYFEWDYDDARIMPIRSRHQFFFSEPLTSVQHGAFAIRNLKWRLKYPPPECEF
jgi:hypothetical protein